MALLVPWHLYAIGARAVALYIKPQAIESLLVHDQSLLALVEAVMHGMRTDLPAVLTVTHAQLEHILLKLLITVVLYNLYLLLARYLHYINDSI